MYETEYTIPLSLHVFVYFSSGFSRKTLFLVVPTKMNKLLSFKFISQIHKSLSNSPLHSHYSKPFHSLSKPSINPNSQPTITHLLLPSPYSSVHQWRSPKMYGFFSNPVLAKKFGSIPHLKGSIKTLLGPRVVFARARVSKAKISSWSSSQGRGWSSWAHGYSVDNIVLGLIMANTAVFMLWRVLDRNFMFKNFTISVNNFTSGRVHTLITSAFSHMDMGHLFSNMLGLYFFGNNVGRVFGPNFLLKLYFSGAVVGSVFYLVHHTYLAKMSEKQGMFGRDSSRTPGLGASGAVNAIMLLDIFLFPKATIYFNFFIPVPAILVGIFLIGNDVLRMVEGDPQISGSAHLGGATVAAVTWLGLKRGIRF